ncbi:hypothetical protein VTL71DRAFT_1170 [Oculimacula yallundae]|uniref:Uncharacterized protein n=1 Tax=Oculimacula yallundae TaxID=86028 RepID=A0ABR4D233_9HELO
MMASQGRYQSSSNVPNFDHDNSVFLSKSNKMPLPGDNFSSQLRTKNLAAGATNQTYNGNSLSSPPSDKSLRSKRMIEELVAENSRLRAEETVRARQAVAHEKMVEDLVQMKMELRTKQMQISDQQQAIQTHLTELGQLRADAKTTLAELHSVQLTQSDGPKAAEAQQQIAQLKTEIRERDFHLREKDQGLREREFEIRTLGGKLELQTVAKDQDSNQRTRDDSQLENERSRADRFQQEVQLLKTQLETEKAMVQQYRDEVSQSQAIQDAAQIATNAERLRGENYLRDIEQRTAELSRLRSQLDSYEARNHKLTQELNLVQASSQRGSAELRDRMQVLEQREQEHANEVADARQSASFFKKNSEATSRKVKGLEAEVKSLMRSLEINGSGAAGNRNSSGPQGGNFASQGAPGAWPEVEDTALRSSTSMRRKPLGGQGYS